MATRSKHWYLLTYDVCNPKRLNRVGRFLKRHGVAVQRSVFLIRTHAEGIKAIQRDCAGILDLDEDELAIVRTSSPDELWRYGCGADQALWANSHTRAGNRSKTGLGLPSMVKKIKRQLLWKH